MITNTGPEKPSLFKLKEIYYTCRIQYIRGGYMVKVTIVEPNITPEENEENLSKVISILEKIVQEINKA